MQSDAEVSRALESHESALFSRWEASQAEDCDTCGEGRECECDMPAFDPCDQERDDDPTPWDYYDCP